MRSGVGSSAEVSISKSSEEGATLMFVNVNLWASAGRQTGANANMRPAVSARNMLANRTPSMMSLEIARSNAIKDLIIFIFKSHVWPLY